MRYYYITVAQAMKKCALLTSADRTQAYGGGPEHGGLKNTRYVGGHHAPMWRHAAPSPPTPLHTLVSPETGYLREAWAIRCQPESLLTFDSDTTLRLLFITRLAHGRPVSSCPSTNPKLRHNTLTYYPPHHLAGVRLEVAGTLVNSPVPVAVVRR
jgi:hypothetical protein